MTSILASAATCIVALLIFAALCRRVLIVSGFKITPPVPWEMLILAGAVVLAMLATPVAPTFAHAAGFSILAAALAVSAVTDLRFGYVFDVVTIPTIFALAVFAYFSGSESSAVAGAAVCAGIILVLFGLTAGRGIGLGDLKLAACIGLAFGAASGSVALGAAFIAGGAHAAVLLAQRKAARGDTMRFAPYLGLGSIVAMLAAQFPWP